MEKSRTPYYFEEVDLDFSTYIASMKIPARAHGGIHGDEHTLRAFSELFKHAVYQLSLSDDGTS